MAGLSDVVVELQEQNRTLDDVKESIKGMLLASEQARKATERQAGDKEEARRERERPRARINRDTPKTFGGAISKGLGEGLGISQLSGWVSNVFGGLGIGSGLALAKVGTAALVASLSSLGIAAVIATWGGSVIKGLFDNLDPNDVVFDDDTKTKVADGLALGTTGAILARTVAKMFGGKFKGLFTIGGFLAGGLYDIISKKIDGSKFEPEFNKAFEDEFGVDLLAGIGSIVGAAAGLLLTKKIYGTVRTALGFTAAAASTAAAAGAPLLGSARPVSPNTTAGGSKFPQARQPAGTVNAQGKKIGGQFKTMPAGGPLKAQPVLKPPSPFGKGGLRAQIAQMAMAYGLSYAIKPLEEFGKAQKDWADNIIPESIRPKGGYENPLEADKVFDGLRKYFAAPGMNTAPYGDGLSLGPKPQREDFSAWWQSKRKEDYNFKRALQRYNTQINDLMPPASLGNGGNGSGGNIDASVSTSNTYVNKSDRIVNQASPSASDLLDMRYNRADPNWMTF